MLRASCVILIKKLFEAGKIDQERKEQCLEFIRSGYIHWRIRDLIAMVLVPKKLHAKDDSQNAYLRAAVSRVSHLKRTVDQYFRLQTQLYWKITAF